ncbi:hypothetical protein RvY_12242 [Ramazzottius varieornatus]|uniref:Uncharacterized protein n=1 Tax=Ramazzottius varieornatus TaxID=947166 RepID=A0A1D1VL55_RAMVA|nr:hypothetical protein RvY_12242 [Ramazzottius varieornatus]
MWRLYCCDAFGHMILWPGLFVEGVRQSTIAEVSESTTTGIPKLATAEISEFDTTGILNLTTPKIWASTTTAIPASSIPIIWESTTLSSRKTPAARLLSRNPRQTATKSHWVDIDMSFGSNITVSSQVVGFYAPSSGKCRASS